MVMDHYVTKQTRTSTRKSKQGNDHQKKNKQPGRGKGVEQLEREMRKNMTEIPSSLHHPSTLQNGVVHYFPHHNQLSLTNSSAAPQMMFPPGPNNLFMDHNVVHPNANPGYRFDNMFSVPNNYVKCGASDACGYCFKKKRVNNNLNTPNQFHYGINNNNVVEKVNYNTGNNLCFSPQLREAMLGYRVWTGGNGVPEYEFFPGKGGETTSSWCVSGGGGTERGGMIGLHGGEGSSCVTAATSNYEEGSICCSIDLSLKL